MPIKCLIAEIMKIFSISINRNGCDWEEHAEESVMLRLITKVPALTRN